MRDNDLARPNQITLEQPTFPYYIRSETEATSYIVIEHMEDLGQDERELFYLAGGEFQVRTSRFGNTLSGGVEITHPWAGDEEGDAARVAQFTIESIQLHAAWGGMVQFSGWLTEARFYPSDYVDPRYETFNPFTGAVELPVPKDDKYGRRYANSGYPHIPPRVQFKDTISLPLFVKVSQYFSRRDPVNEYFDSSEVRAAVRRQEREDKIAAYQAGRAAKVASIKAERLARGVEGE